MKKLNISLLALAVTAGGAAVATQIKKRGGVKPAVGDLKTGTAKAIKAIKAPVARLVANNTNTTDDVEREEQLQDDQVMRAQG